MQQDDTERDMMGYWYGICRTSFGMLLFYLLLLLASYFVTCYPHEPSVMECVVSITVIRLTKKVHFTRPTFVFVGSDRP